MKTLKAIVTAFGAREIFMLVGLLLIGCGVGMVSIPAALVIDGAIMIAVSVFGVRAAVTPPAQKQETAQTRAFKVVD